MKTLTHSLSLRYFRPITTKSTPLYREIAEVKSKWHGSGAALHPPPHWGPPKQPSVKPLCVCVCVCVCVYVYVAELIGCLYDHVLN